MPQMGYRMGANMAGRLGQAVDQAGQNSFLGQGLSQLIGVGRQIINQGMGQQGQGARLPNEAPPLRQPMGQPQQRPQQNMLNAPGSTGAGRVIDQATLANYMSQAAKDKWAGDFHKAISALALHPLLDSNRAKEYMPKYVQAFNTIVESGFGRDIRPAMQSMLQHFFDRALGRSPKAGGTQNGR